MPHWGHHTTPSPAEQGLDNPLIIKPPLFQDHDPATPILATIGLRLLLNLVSQIVRGHVQEPGGRCLFLAVIR